MLKKTLSLKFIPTKTKMAVPALTWGELAEDLNEDLIKNLQKRVENLEKRLAIPQTSYKTPCPFCEGRGLVYCKWTGNTTECQVCGGVGYN